MDSCLLSLFYRSITYRRFLGSTIFMKSPGSYQRHDLFIKVLRLLWTDPITIPSREVSILWSYLYITLLFSSHVYLILLLNLTTSEPCWLYNLILLLISEFSFLHKKWYILESIIFQS